MSSKLRNKPQLTIETNSDDNEQYKEAKYLLPAAKSAKNNHQLKRFNFGQVKTITPFDKVLKIDKIEKLQKQKKQLLQSLEILKNGAVSAIVQKEEIIEKLRKLFNQTHIAIGGNDQDDSKVQQLQNLLRYIKDLEDERTELKTELQRVKLRFEMEIQEKQQIIEQLTNQLNWSTERIDNLEKYDKLLEEKIKVMEQSNENLSVLLNQSQQNLKDERKKHTQQSLLLKNRSSDSFHQVGSDSENGSTWNPRSIRKITYNGSDRDLNISLSRSLDESIIESKIQQIKNEHMVEIQDLTQFYEERIQSLKKLCEKYTEPYISEKTNNTKLNNTNVVTEVHDNHSNYSGFTNELRDDKNKEVTEKILKKNLSLGSFKSGIFKMDTIDQKQQIENPAKTLRKQLSQFQNSNEGNYFKKATSELSLGGHSSSSSNKKSNNQQKQSQFSNKYFEYPASSNFKKNKSQASNTKSEASTPRKIRQINKRQSSEEDKARENNEMNKNEESGNHLWEKIFWFASGTLTGGLLLKFGNKIFK